MKAHHSIPWLAALALGVFAPGAGSQQVFAPGGRGGPGGFGPGGGQEREIVAQFDKDDDGLLDTSERAAARAWLQTQPQQGGPGGPMGPGGGRRGPGRGAGAVPPDGAGAPPPDGRGAGFPGAGANAPPRGRGAGFPGAGANAPPNGRGAGFPPNGRMGGPRGGGPGGRAAMAPSSPGVPLTPDQVTRYRDEPLYDPATLRTLFLRFESSDWEQELADFHNTDVEVPAQVTVDGVTYRDVGVSFRGASSYSMVPAGSKRSFNLSFDFAHEDQRLGGYRTLNLLNSNNDPAFLRTALYSLIAREYLPAPKVNYVRVVVNGENWGVYANAQQFNKDFTQEFFGSDDGARWKVPGSPNGRGGMEYLGEEVEAYKRIYEIRSKDDPESWADLIGLFRVLEQTPPDELEAALAPILDVDGALRFLAVDVALANSDGFWTRASDYSIYQDTDGRFHILPHDMNEALGAEGRGNVDPLVGLNDSSKALRSRLLAVPALRERYLGYVREIATNWLDWNRVGPIAQRYRALIEADVLRDTHKLYGNEAFGASFDALRTFFETRRSYLLGQS